MPPIAPAGSRMRLLPSFAAALSRAKQGGIGERADRDHQAIDAAAQHRARNARHTACCPATSATIAGRRAIRSSSASTMAMPGSAARAASARPGRASAPTIRTPSPRRSAQRRNHVLRNPAPADESDRVIAGSRLIAVEPDAGELPLRQFLHGVAHAFASEAARADAAERIGVEPEAAGVVDPQRADPQLARDLECGLEARGEAGALQAELGRIGERERRVDVGDAAAPPRPGRMPPRPSAARPAAPPPRSRARGCSRAARA